jgi:hypothetical protein
MQYDFCVFISQEKWFTISSTTRVKVLHALDKAANDYTHVLTDFGNTDKMAMTWNAVLNDRQQLMVSLLLSEYMLLTS